MTMLPRAAVAIAQAPPPGIPPGMPPGPPPNIADLARKTQNPVSDLVSVPFQFNFNSGGDLNGRTALTVNLQPVIPFKINGRLNAVARTVVPLDSLPAGPIDRASGIGDIQEQFFLTPARPGQ